MLGASISVGIPGGASELGGGFSVNRIAGLAVWLRADVGTVSSWTDQSGNGRTPVQATGSLQPTINPTGGPNSKPCYVFDGVDDFMTTGAIASYGSATTQFLVAKWNTVFAAQGSICDGGNANHGRFYRSAAGTVNVLDGSGVSAAGQTETAWHVWTFLASGTLETIYVEGTSVSSGAAVAGTKDGLTIGAIGAGGGDWSNCSVAEFIAYGRALSVGEMAQVVSYLRTRYAL